MSETKKAACDCAVHVGPGHAVPSTSESKASGTATSAATSAAAAPTVDLTNIRAMKAYLTSVGVPFADCLEKDDFVARCRETLARNPPQVATSSTTTTTDTSTTGSGGNGNGAIIETIAVGPLSCNMTIIADPVTKNAVLCDPGGDHDVSTPCHSMLSHLVLIFVFSENTGIGEEDGCQDCSNCGDSCTF
jgi:hypothetical protein